MQAPAVHRPQYGMYTAGAGQVHPSHLARGDSRANGDQDPRVLNGFPKSSGESRQPGTTGDATSQSPAYTHRVANGPRAGRAPPEHVRQGDDSLERPRTPPRLARIFHRDRGSLMPSPNRDLSLDRDRLPHSSPRYDQPRDNDDARSFGRRKSDRDDRRSPPRPIHALHDGRYRSNSPRDDQPSLNPKRPGRGSYDGGRRSGSLERRGPLSPLMPRPSLSSPFRQTSLERRLTERAPALRDSDGPRLYQNLSWTAPKNGAEKQRQRRPSVDTGHSDRGGSGQAHSSPGSLSKPPVERVNFNGLEYVPTGPKAGTKPPSLPNVPSLPRMADSILTAPHAFISPKALPPRPATVKHLAGFCGTYQPDGIHVDDTGYFLTFPDTHEGHDRLNALFRNKNGNMMFSQYVVTMQIFHGGQLPARGAPGAVRPFDEAPLPISKKLELLRTSSALGVSPVAAAEQKLQNHVHPSRLTLLQEMNSEGHAGSEVQALSPAISSYTIPSLRSSSPLRVSSRQDVDDASSISGKTTSSNISGSKRPKCHVCKLAPALEADALVHCSTCPRRYHRRCHASPAVPSAATSAANEMQDWQCRRCVNKQVAPRQRFPGLAADVQAGPDSFSSDPEQPPAKRIKLSERDAATDESAASPNVESIATPAGHSKAGTPVIDRTVAALSTGPSATEKMTMNTQIEPPRHPTSGDNFLDEAEKLVENSFTTPTGSRALNGVPKPLKPNLVRKKITQPVQKELGAITPVSARSSEEIDRRREPDAVPQSSRGRPVLQAHAKESSISSSAVDSVVQEQSKKATAIRTKQNFTKCRKCKKQVIAGETDARPLCVKCRQLALAKKAGLATNGTEILIAKQSQTGPQMDAARLATAKTAEATATSTDKTKTGDGRELQSYQRTTNPTEGGNAAKAVAVGETTGGGARPGEEGTNDPLDFWRDKERDSASVEAGHHNGVEASQATSSHSLREQTTELPQTVGVRLAQAFADNAETTESDRLSTPPPSPCLLEMIDESQARRGSGIGTRFQQASDESNPLSQGANGGKRRRRDRIGGTGFGDSRERPSGTYEILIKFALCDAPTGSLQTRGVCQWIANNIPNYRLGEDTWESGIGTTLSAHVGKKNKKLFDFLEFQKGDDDRFGIGGWYMLKEGLAEKLPRWDPELKQGVSPLRDGDSRKKQEDTHEDDSDEEGAPRKPRRAAKHANAARRKRLAEAAKSATTVQSMSSIPPALNAKNTSATTSKPALGSSPKSTSPDLDDPLRIGFPEPSGRAVVDAAAAQDDELVGTNAPDRMPARDEAAASASGDAERQGELDVSSDDEPLACVRQAQVSQHVAPDSINLSSLQRGEAANSEDMMDIDPKPKAATCPRESVATKQPAPSTSSVATEAKMPRQTLKTKALRIQPVNAGSLSLAQLVKLEADNIDYSAKSLFMEWPEYDPKNQVDRSARVEEIKKRPTRKQMFGTPAMYSRLGGRETTEEPSAKASFERTIRSSPRKMLSSSIPTLEENVEHFDTLEEFFDLPPNPMPVIKDGQLVYRDGTRDAQGKLPRASVYYTTGYN